MAGIDCGARGLRKVLGKTIRGSFRVAKIALVRAAKRLPRRSDSLLLDELDSDESEEPPELPEVPSVAHIELRIRAWLATNLKVSRDGPVTARLLRLFAVAFRGANAPRRYAQQGPDGFAGSSGDAASSSSVVVRGRRAFVGLC